MCRGVRSFDPTVYPSTPHSFLLMSSSIGFHSEIRLLEAILIGIIGIHNHNIAFITLGSPRGF